MVRIVLKFLAVAALATGMINVSACAARTDNGSGEHWTWGTSDEISQRNALILAVKTAFHRQDFAALDALETQYRDVAAVLPSGGSKLSLYYEALTREIWQIDRTPSSGKCDALWKPFLDKWQAVSPRAPAPIIARASMLDTAAWCYRGDNTVGHVSADSWKPYHDNIKEAAALLENSKAIASVDPYYYTMLVGLAIAQGTSRDDFEAILAEASSRFPYHYDTYYAAYRYYQPQWYGSYAEIDQFARYVVERTKSRDGSSGYFRLYFHLALCRCFQDMQAMDWSLMKNAMADLAERYPNDFTYTRLAQLACVRGHEEEATLYLTKLTVNDPAAWAKKYWEECRALVGPSKLPFPQ